MRSALFDSDWGPVALAVGVGCLALVATLAALARPRGAWLRARLDPYGRLNSAAAAAATVDASPGWRPQTERLYGATERWLEDKRWWKSSMRLLERAGSQLRPVEFFYGTVLFTVAVVVAVAVLTGSLGLGIVAAPVGGVLPWVWLKGRARRRLRAFDNQLADVLLAISSSLKIGLSFNHAIAAIVDDGQAPASEEFERLLNETELGRPMEDSLSAMADRIQSEDLQFVLMTVAIQREVGGNLADLFHTASETVRERHHFRRKVKALTAMGRMSAYILVALPFVVAAGVALTSPGYIHPLFATTAGHILIIVMLGMMAIGSLFLKKIVTVKG